MIESFEIGDYVTIAGSGSVGNHYSFTGHIVSIFRKRSGAFRCVVESKDGGLHVYNLKKPRLLSRGEQQVVADMEAGLNRP